MPWPSALTRVLTNFHIFACRAHIAIAFTYMETPLSLLSYYAHSILLCCSSGVSGPTMFGIVDTGAYKFVAFFPTNHHISLQHPGDTTKAAFFDLGALFGHVIAHLPVWDKCLCFFFFSQFFFFFFFLNMHSCFFLKGK